MLDNKIHAIVDIIYAMNDTEDGLYSTARVKSLGLTAYSGKQNRDEAIKTLRLMFDSMVILLRKNGTLQQVLDKKQIKYYSEQDFRIEYNADKKQYIVHCDKFQTESIGASEEQAISKLHDTIRDDFNYLGKYILSEN